jgi:threonylcarbamoyladenosine tRNA methylthiotransferase MtaB
MKIYLDTIGCRLNQSEIEAMARGFRAAGHQIVTSAEMADMAVVNTCAVTNEAAADSRGKIRQLARAGVSEIVATGCWATLQPRQALDLPNVLRVVQNDRKDHLVADVLDLPKGQESFELEPIAREPLPGLHRRTRAFIKVQDGCDNHCTFCVTTMKRMYRVSAFPPWSRGIWMRTSFPYGRMSVSCLTCTCLCKADANPP